MEKKNIIIIVLSVLVIGLFGYIVYDKILDNKEEIVDNTKPNDNNVNDKNDNVKDDNDNVSDENVGENNQPIIEKNKNIFTNYIGPLGWIAYISSFDNNSEIKKNIDFFSDDYNKTLFVMEYIQNRDGSNNFINIVNDEYPAYGIDLYLYDDFNVEYFEMFGENYTKDAKIIDDKKYVVYSNRHHGSNGVYAENINIIDVIKEDDNYIATIELFYSDYTNINKINATIKYKKNGDKIIFKSFIVN